METSLSSTLHMYILHITYRDYMYTLLIPQLYNIIVKIQQQKLTRVVTPLQLTQLLYFSKFVKTKKDKSLLFSSRKLL